MNLKIKIAQVLGEEFANLSVDDENVNDNSMNQYRIYFDPRYAQEFYSKMLKARHAPPALEARARLGLTQEKFASLMGVNVETVWTWESCHGGRQEPDLNQKILILKYLSINWEDISLKKLIEENRLDFDEVAEVLGTDNKRILDLAMEKTWPTFGEKLKIYGLKRLAEKGELKSEEF
jgi:DNA-binding XRE family transcriptional regulator